MSQETKKISSGFNNKGEYFFVYDVILGGKKLKLRIKVDRLKGETDEVYLKRINKEELKIRH